MGHGRMHADMILEKELRVLDSQAAERNCVTLAKPKLWDLKAHLPQQSCTYFNKVIASSSATPCGPGILQTTT